jgi:phosphoglycerate kinase
MARLRTLEDLDFAGRRVLLRADLNVPLTDGRVADDARILAALPTIEELQHGGAAIVLVSHLGRPHGTDPALSLRPVAQRLRELTGTRVTLAPAVVGEAVQRLAERLKAGEILLLENVRFEDGETKNDPKLARALAALADLYVNDAFAAAHRAHASTTGVAALLPSAAGRLIERELDALGTLLEHPSRPLVVVLGGAKVSDKLGVVERFLNTADHILIGGAMAFPFLAAQGHSLGATPCAPADVELAAKTLDCATPGRLELPEDLFVELPNAEIGGVARALRTADIPDRWVGLDIGPRTAAHFAQRIRRAGTVFWNGPMGRFESEPFADGTRTVAQALADSPATTILGGGETLAAVREFGLAERIDHLSTGGGATLQLLAGHTLPGVEALRTPEDEMAQTVTGASTRSASSTSRLQ